MLVLADAMAIMRASFSACEGVHGGFAELRVDVFGGQPFEQDVRRQAWSTAAAAHRPRER